MRMFVLPSRDTRPDPKRAGFILIAVLVVITLLCMIAVSLLFRMKAEDAATAASGSSEQAWATAMAGVQEALRVVGQNPVDPAAWRDNPRLFRDRFVCEDGVDRWFYTVWSAAEAVDSREEIRYGLADEAARLNVNAATETNLLRLPGISTALAHAVLDFLDSDSTAQPEGAEQDFYDGLPRPYAIRNGPLASLDELLLVRGLSAPLLYGEDANLNFILDANEDDGEQTQPPDNSDGKMEAGLRPLLTVCSYDLNVDNDGAPRTNLNDPLDPLPQVELPPALTNYILLMRSNKITVAHAAELLEATHRFKDASGKEAEWASGVGKAELPLLLDLFSDTDEERQTGLLNVNTAPAKVLATLPELDDSVAESIVSARRNVAPEKRRTIAWLYAEGLLEAAQFKQVAPFLTARSYQFNFHVVGYGVPSGRYCVLDVTVDLGQGRPVITSLRDLTRLGMPFRIEGDKPKLTAGPPRREPAARQSHRGVGKEAGHG